MDEVKKQEYNKKYYQQHKDYLHDMKMLHREDTKLYNKEYYENKKQARVLCPNCGKEYNYYSFSEHVRYNRCKALKILNELTS
jgi:transposase